MANPKSLESSVQQFYESVEDCHEIKSGFDCGFKCDVKKQEMRPQTAIIDDYTNIERAIKAAKLTESIRHELYLHNLEDPFGSFFHDLSGWDLDKNKTETLNDNSCISYLQFSDKKYDTLDTNSCNSLSKKKASGRALAIRALLASAKKPATASNVGYRSKNEWGSEEESNSRPYALQIPIPDVCEEDEDENFAAINGLKVPSNQEVTVMIPVLTDSMDQEIRDLDQELNQLIEATAAKAKSKTTDSRPVSTKRAVSGNNRPTFQQNAYFSVIGEKERRGEQMSITGQKYHNDCTLLQEKYNDRPCSANRAATTPTSLPKISNQLKKPFLATAPNSKKEQIPQNNSINDKRNSVLEIPKWYNDSGTKATHDHNLIRYMEIMGCKSRLRTPRKLSSTGFLSLPMPNQPPETRGLVFEKKPRGFSSILDEMVQEDQSLKLEVLKVPIMNPNQRSFAEEVHLNRQGKSNRK